uniref:Uncharacterized protein n=1 Tax=Theileria annulata TaxID=5874 RepID=A0A3B0MJ83_THEAN
MDSQKDLRIGLWVSKLSDSFKNLPALIKHHEVFLSGCFEFFVNNYDNLISDDVYKLLRNLNDVLVLTANYPYLTHSDISFSKRPTVVDSLEDKSIDISPVRSFSPYSSPKYELNEEEFTDTVMGVVVVFLILTKEVFKSNGLEHIKTYISGIMERFKVSNQNIKFVLVKHGTKDLFMTDQGNVQRSSNSTHKNNDHQSLISIINELETYLLIYHNVDTIETDDDGDLNNQIAKDEPEMMKKMYAKPYEVIESLKISEDNFYNVLKNIEIPGKKRKTLGKITSKRFLTF